MFSRVAGCCVALYDRSRLNTYCSSVLHIISCEARFERCKTGPLQRRQEHTLLRGTRCSHLLFRTYYRDDIPMTDIDWIRYFDLSQYRLSIRVKVLIGLK